MSKPLQTSICTLLSILSLMIWAHSAWAERLCVRADIANIRSEPGTASEVMWQVEKYHPLSVIGKKGAWVKFEDFEGDRGWIHGSLLVDMRCVVVKKNTCNVRSGPGKDNDVLFTVDKGVPFRVLESKGKWLHGVHQDGDKGWIHRSLVW